MSRKIEKITLPADHTIPKGDRIRRAIKELGGTMPFLRLMNAYGMNVHPQTTYLWIRRGSIPGKYFENISKVMDNHGMNVTDKGVLMRDCFDRKGITRRIDLPPNLPLLEALETYEGNIRNLYENFKDENGENTLTYQAIYNWFRIGRIPVIYRPWLLARGWPAHVMTHPLDVKAEDIL